MLDDPVTTYLFVGGPRHGELRPVPDDAESVEDLLACGIEEPASEPKGFFLTGRYTVRSYWYRRTNYRMGGKLYTLYRGEGVSGAIFRALPIYHTLPDWLTQNRFRLAERLWWAGEGFEYILEAVREAHEARHKKMAIGLRVAKALAENG